VLTVNDKCFVTERGSRMMNHDCDMIFGDPGSPILLRDGDKHDVCALNVAVGSRVGKSFGIAIFLPRGAVN
tara:strand:+ start:27 stop:239 length:213 start_codon:yes stop_codon:yes gene_type:complete